MPRQYISKSSRPYRRYDPSLLKTAIKDYEIGNKSLFEVSNQYNIPKSVLHRHVSRKMKPQGGQRSLSEEAEKYIIKYINVCSEWGHPLDVYDLRVIIKGYLDKVGLEIKRFKNNLPGVEYIKCFLKRYNKEISGRLRQNIKRSRATIAPETIEDYFKELEMSLEGVPLCNIVNYNESNFADDPGKKKVLTKRGVKHPKKFMKHSESSTSLMMAASADGTLLPCYVVYNASHVCNTWTLNGPLNCKYNCTSSGWFDDSTFKDWIETVALPYFNGKTGKKILIGDNLSSHLSIDIIRKCQEYNIHFVFLPPNSTHLTQPLDVAFFEPMKIAWRDILLTWKKTESQALPSLPKIAFPILLKKMLDKIQPNSKQNILAGFAKCGIYPLNKEKVLNRLPGNTSRTEFSIEDKEAIDESVLNLLKEMRYGSQNSNITSKKLNKINVMPDNGVEDSEYIDSDISSAECSDVDKITKKPKDSKNCELDKKSSHAEKDNLILQSNLTIKGKGIGKKTKAPYNVLTNNPEIITDNQFLNVQYEFIDIDKVLIVIDNNKLVTEEITIDGTNNHDCFNEQQESSFTAGNTFDEDSNRTNT